jgi:hypothetical protein
MRSVSSTRIRPIQPGWLRINLSLVTSYRRSLEKLSCTCRGVPLWLRRGALLLPYTHHRHERIPLTLGSPSLPRRRTNPRLQITLPRCRHLQMISPPLALRSVTMNSSLTSWHVLMKSIIPCSRCLLSGPIQSPLPRALCSTPKLRTAYDTSVDLGSRRVIFCPCHLSWSRVFRRSWLRLIRLWSHSWELSQSFFVRGPLWPRLYRQAIKAAVPGLFEDWSYYQ